MDLSKKIEEAEAFLKQIKDRQLELTKELESLHNAEQQIIGRLSTYRELDEENNDTPDDANKVVTGEVID